MKWLLVAFAVAWIVAQWRLSRARRLRVPDDDPALAQTVDKLEAVDREERGISRSQWTRRWANHTLELFGFTGRDVRTARRPSTWFTVLAALALLSWPLLRTMEVVIVGLALGAFALSLRGEEGRIAERRRDRDEAAGG